MRGLALAMLVAMAAMLVGCSDKSARPTAPQLSERVYELAPRSVRVKAGIVGGELRHMRVAERVEEATGRVDSGPRLYGRLVLKNLSTDRSVLVDGGKVVFADAKDRPIGLGPESVEPAIRLGDSYNTTSTRLAPGQELARDVDVEFPVEALEPGRLHGIHVQINYTIAPFKRDLLEFPVALRRPEG